VESQADDARFEPIDRQQVVLEPLDIELLIPPEHAARSIWNILGRLDLSRFLGEVKAVKGHAGRNRWEPRLLIALWIYAYSRGVSSAREIERQAAYEPALRWLTGLNIVNHHTLSDFRVEHGAALQNLFAQVLAILSMEKLITLERVTVDGTKVRACVSKKTFSRASKIEAHLQVAREHLAVLQNDEVEQEKRARNRAAQQRAARERVERLEAALQEVQRLQAEKKHETHKLAQASTTDPDAQFMRNSDHGLAPSYNVQLATDAKHKLVVDVAVSKQPSDADHLLPTMDRLKATHGVLPQQMVADGDYTNRAAVMGAADRGVDYYGSWGAAAETPMPYGIDAAFQPQAFSYDEQHNQLICPQGKRLTYRSSREDQGRQQHFFVAQRQDCQACPERARCSPKNAMLKRGRTVTIRIENEIMERYHAKMATEAAKAIYKNRAPVAEFPNAWLKDKLKWVRLRCRGLAKAQTEALWTCLTYNLQRYFKLSCTPTA
jgi:transposase